MKTDIQLLFSVSEFDAGILYAIKKCILFILGNGTNQAHAQSSRASANEGTCQVVTLNQYLFCKPPFQTETVLNLCCQT